MDSGNFSYPYGTWLLTTLVLILPPLLFIFVRNSVKINRQRIVRDLSAVFSMKNVGLNARDEDMIPSFEFVKYKYFLGSANDSDAVNHEDFAWWAWGTGIAALLLVFSVIWFLIFHTLCSPASGDTPAQGCGSLSFQNSNIFGFNSCRYIASIQATSIYYGLLASFAGSYIYMITNFFQAINNFDFNPASFLSGAKDFIVSAILAVIFYFVIGYGYSILGHGNEVQSTALTAYIVISFATGLLPGSAKRTLLDRAKLAHVKRDDPGIYKRISVTPVDIIDGINSEIRDRLSDHHIHSTQNLATANPLMLFVETPYGVYQIMDWVAQAQLCCAVGSDKLLKFWRLGFRTLFDLERAALNSSYKNEQLLLAIGEILFANQECSNSRKPLAETVTQDLVIAAIQVKLDDPHVHRLRQIYIKVGERLGTTNRRFENDARK